MCSEGAAAPLREELASALLPRGMAIHMDMSDRDNAAGGTTLNMILQVMTNDAVGSKVRGRTENATVPKRDAPPTSMTDALSANRLGGSHDSVARTPRERVGT